MGDTIEELERRVAKIEEHIGMGKIQNMCDRCGRLASPLFMVYACSFREERYCFRCVAYIYMIDIEYWLLGKLLPIRKRVTMENKIGVFALLCAAIGIITAVLICFWG